MAGSLDLARIFLELLAVLVVAKLAGEVAERLKQPSVLGELVAGVVLGPSLLGWVSLPGEVPSPLLPVHLPALVSGNIVLFLAELGVVLLLFEVGLENDVKALVRVGASAALVALVGIVVSFALGFAASVAFARLGYWRDDLLFHVFLGATFTATSVGITARVFSDLGRVSSREARVILGAAVLDDVGGLLILAVVSALAAGALTFTSVGVETALAAGFLVVSLVVGLRVMPRVLAVLSFLRVRGVLVSAALAFILALAILSETAGLAPIVGSFAAGLILAQTKERASIGAAVRPLADLFVPFFFVTMGLRLDAHQLAGAGGTVLVLGVALTLVAVLGKLACGLGIVDKGVSRTVVGVGMVPRGEVGLIFASLGLTTIGIPPFEYAAILVVVLATTFATPVALKVVIGRQPMP